MSIITRVLKQTAIYWAPDSVDQYGQTTYLSPVELRCRWEDVMQEIITADGAKQVSKTKVMVNEDVVIGGVMMLGSLESGDSGESGGLNEEDPKANEGAWEIINVGKIPNFRATEFLRLAYL